MTGRILVAIAATLSLGACATNDIQAGRSAGRLTASSLAEVSGGTQVRVVLGTPTVGMPYPDDVAAYMDSQEAALRVKLAGTGVRVYRDGDRILLTLPGNITFNTNSADIRSDFFDVLNDVSHVLRQYPSTTIQITGHTDTTGGDKINLPLSERRADSVAMYLRSQKIGLNRITTAGYGSRYPVASNDTAAGREQNRRVEILIIPVLSSSGPGPLSGAYFEDTDGLREDDGGPDLTVDAGQADG